MELVLALVLVLALLGAFWFRRAGRRMRAETGLPIAARVVYSDTFAWERVEKPLFSRRHRLAGKPDYVVKQESGELIPIEVKPNRRERQPRRSDTMQLMAYGVLVEEQYGTRAGYGLLKYRDEVLRIEFSDELRAEFFSILEEMRAARHAANVARTHEDARRCAACGYRHACDEQLTEL